ncbi:MAG: class I SAM-dependent methyltransferase [Burkholderiales bacterium]|nr:class I SAM-dependent methyltransferase [Burkholderiales bacterium]
MAGKFGLLAKLEFLQEWASALLARIPPPVVHNLEKYHALKKAHYLTAIEELEGDYLEFGVYTGSSFCHSLRCCRSLAALHPKMLGTGFFGFDSFGGFGTLADDDKHPFYEDQNFATRLGDVERRVARVACGLRTRLVPGFFSESLKAGAAAYGITRARVVFVDSDTHASAREALLFCLPIVQAGTYVVLDDYFSYRGSEERGVARAFAEFLEAGRFRARQVFTYGMGGVVYVISGEGG